MHAMSGMCTDDDEVVSIVAAAAAAADDGDGGRSVIEDEVDDKDEDNSLSQRVVRANFMMEYSCFTDDTTGDMTDEAVDAVALDVESAAVVVVVVEE